MCTSIEMLSTSFANMNIRFSEFVLIKKSWYCLINDFVIYFVVVYTHKNISDNTLRFYFQYSTKMLENAKQSSHQKNTCNCSNVTIAYTY